MIVDNAENIVSDSDEEGKISDEESMPSLEEDDGEECKT